jgi:hypothetical protein
VILALLAAVELMVAGGLFAVAALAQAFAAFAPAPVLALVAIPLVMLPFGRAAPVARASRGDPPAWRPDVGAARRVRTAAIAGTPFGRPVVPGAPVPARTLVGGSDTPAASAPAPQSPPSETPSPTPRPVLRRDAMVRVPFDRIASQLPAEAFVLPFDRLAESLKEPNVLLVPERVVLAELREGGIAIDWATVAAQFPELALGISAAEFRKRYPGLRLSLPVDEVLAQLPPDTVPLASAVLNAEPTRASAPWPRPSPPPAPPPPPPAAAPAPPMTPPGPPVVVSPPMPAMTAAHPRDDTAAAKPEAVDRNTIARVAACFTGVGTYEARGERVAGRTVVALVAPTLPGDAVLASATRLLPFVGVDRDGLTVRTTRAVLVLAAGATPVIVTTRRAGTAVALLELRARRAALAEGPAAVVAVPPAGRTLRAMSADAHVTAAADALSSLGAVSATIFADSAARVYVFGPEARDAAELAALGLALRETTGAGADLGDLVSVVVRGGAERVLVRPLRARAGLLVAAGPVSRPGRLHGDAERAAAMLEAV